MKEINEIKSQIGMLETNLRNAKEHLKAAYLKHHNLAVGMAIMKLDHSGSEKGIVFVSGWSYSSPDAVKIKKDGSASAHSAGYMGQWRHLTSEEKATLGETQ